MYIDNWTEEEHSRLIELLKNNPIIKGNYLHEDGIPAEDINKYVDTNAVEALTEILTNFHAEVEKARFEKIAEGGADAILANVKEQMPLIIKRERANIERAEKDTGQDLSNLKNFTPEDAANILLRELSLHVSAISGQEEAQQQFVTLLIGYINKSKAIGGKVNEYLKKAIEEAILTPIKEENALQLRQKPINLKKYGLMKASAASQLLLPTDIFQIEPNGQLRLIYEPEQNRKKENQIITYVSLSFIPEDENYKINRRLTAYDKSVYQTISSLYVSNRQLYPEGPLEFTYREIYKAMAGKSLNDKAGVSDKQLDKLRNSIRKMSITLFEMNAGEEVKKHGLKFMDPQFDTKGRCSTYLINCNETFIQCEKGHIANGIVINQTPILYVYNQAKGQVELVDHYLLDVSDKTSISENVTEFRDYLLLEIKLMKNYKEDKKAYPRNNIISLATLYEKTGIMPPEERIKDYNTADKAKKIRKLRDADTDKIEAILTSWKGKGWIKNFTRTATGSDTKYQIKL